jgi:hypothetical protein
MRVALEGACSFAHRADLGGAPGQGVVVGRRGRNRCAEARKSREPGLHDAAGSGQQG